MARPTLQITGASFVTDSDQAGNLVDGAIAPDHRVCVADFTEKRVHCLQPAYKRWVEIGRVGDGPGEFHAPYRVAFTPSNQLWVWDYQTQQLSRFDATGHFIGRADLPYHFRQVDNILAIGEDQLVFCGVTSIASPAHDNALHLFHWRGDGQPLRLIKAFGQLPTSSVREKIDHWGAGSVTRAANGNLYYTRRVPWDIWEFRLDGTLVRTFPGPENLVMGADSAVQISEHGDQMTVGWNRNITVVYPLRLTDLGERWILTGRRIVNSDESHVIWDLLDRATGRRITQLRLPPEVATMSGVGYDAVSRTLWGIGSKDDVEGLWALRIELGQP